MYKLTSLVLMSFFVDAASAQENYDIQRHQMVTNQLIARDITDVSTLRAMRQVERHQFVPLAMKSRAYTDSPLPIGYQQTISQPYIVAYMTQELKLKPTDRVLEIGTGSGYQAAVLATIVKMVYTIEIVAPLGKIAKGCFDALGYTNIITKIGDGYHGWPDQAPFDAIMVTAAVTEIPPALLEQLAEGGRMIIPVGQKPFHRNLVRVTRKKGKIKTKALIPVAFVPFARSKNKP